VWELKLAKQSKRQARQFRLDHLGGGKNAPAPK
jgi:hypothetical protein